MKVRPVGKLWLVAFLMAGYVAFLSDQTEKPAFSQNSSASNNQTGKTEAKAVLREYDDITSEEFESPRILILKAQQALRHRDVDRAVSQMERAMALAPKDVDVHYFYALSLEAKMKRARFKDEKTFGNCVSSWLKLYRGEVGDEKGLTFKGVGLAAGSFSDDEMAMHGKEHLLSLVGFLPKAWESDKKYVKRAVASLGQTSPH
ncbi:MAG: hypothetical protein BWY75_00570 [bacterium ADurb.Bin425]|nr:MAG: hypothetical protein BWY75_00570 [bacterium ADurb.Bin425]